MKHFFLFLILLLTHCVYAQMPDTDIWLFDLTKKGDSFKLSNGINFTNRPGYDNQPSFSPDNKFIYYTSYRNGQSDIYQYDIKGKTTKQFTATPESEYSPIVTPDGKYVSVVRVEKDSAQRLWKFPIAGGPPVLVFKHIDSIGYYCWLNNSELNLFLLGNPEKIVHADTKLDSKKNLHVQMLNGGRSLYPGFLISKTDSNHWYICSNLFVMENSGNTPTKKEYKPLIETIRLNEDFGMTSRVLLIRKDTPLNNSDSHVVTEYNFFMSSGAWIYKYTVTNANALKTVSSYNWTLPNDLSSVGLKKIGRIAISPDGKKMAIVSSN